MPSQLLQELAISQLELLASSLSRKDGRGRKVKSMALYLPQENARTGQLEFLPAILYPRPSSERVFIASDSDSRMAPTMPRTLTKLPGFAHATSLLPGYPMVFMASSSDPEDAGVGLVEEVLCDAETGGTALSVPLFAGSQTVGVLLVSPAVSSRKNATVWTDEDRRQVAIAAKSLSLALSMDSERTVLKERYEKVQTALSDSLHQFKNPLQALRTYGKLLQRRIAGEQGGVSTPQVLELAEHLMVQSDRLVDRLKPVDAIVDSMGSETRRPLLNPVEAKALVPWKAPLIPFEAEALEFARRIPPRNATALVTNPLKKTVIAADARMEKSDDARFLQSAVSHEENSRLAPPSLLGDMVLEMSFIGDVLAPVFDTFRAIADEQSILFSVEEEEDLPGVVVWPQALQESVINLLDNAFKYGELAQSEHTAFKQQVRVRLLPNRCPVEASGVTILVEDNGPGIHADDRQKIFHRGARGAQADTVNGSGIGLDIALSLVEEMGGSLQVVDNARYQKSLSGAILELVVFRKRPLQR